MNKHELKSLLENIYEAMILPSLADRALSNPSLMNPDLSKPLSDPNLLGTTPYPTNDPINEPTDAWCKANGWTNRAEYDEWIRIADRWGRGEILTIEELEFYHSVRLRRIRLAFVHP